MTEYKLNYNFQPPDKRDHIFKAEIDKKNNLEIATIIKPVSNSIISKNTSISPSSYIITNLPNILNQGNLGSCVPNAFAYSISSQTYKTFNSSRLYHYLNCRIIDNTPLNKDYGTTIRTACSAIRNNGAIPESIIAYNINLFANYPSLSTIQKAKYFKLFNYTFITQDLISIKNCLNTYRVPIIFGFLVYSSFMTNNVVSNGIVPNPNILTESFLGGHCMNIIGYDDSKQWFICANSWGTSWGKNGLCFMPYTYLLNSTLARDFCFTQFVY
jgi:C1A family cysteine protease